MISTKRVHWLEGTACKIDLMCQWQPEPHSRLALLQGSSFPHGQAVCAYNPLVVQCLEAAALLDNEPHRRDVGSRHITDSGTKQSMNLSESSKGRHLSLYDAMLSQVLMRLVGNICGHPFNKGSLCDGLSPSLDMFTVQQLHDPAPSHKQAQKPRRVVACQSARQGCTTGPLLFAKSPVLAPGQGC